MTCFDEAILHYTTLGEGSRAEKTEKGTEITYVMAEVKSQKVKIKLTLVGGKILYMLHILPTSCGVRTRSTGQHLP